MEKKRIALDAQAAATQAALEEAELVASIELAEMELTTDRDINSDDGRSCTQTPTLLEMQTTVTAESSARPTSSAEEESLTRPPAGGGVGAGHGLARGHEAAGAGLAWQGAPVQPG